MLYRLSACAGKILQKQTVFVFTESWSMIKSSKEPIILLCYFIDAIMTCIMNFVVYLKYEPTIMVMLQFGLFHS